MQKKTINHTLKIIAWVGLLIIIDQFIKIIIHKYFMDLTFTIIPHLLEFRPKFNDKYNYLNYLLNSHLGVNIDFWILIIVFFIGFLIMLMIYDYMKIISKEKKVLDLLFIFWIAGAASTLVGWLFWENGCLDYIYLKPLFIFDLKDLYLNIFVILCFIFIFKHKKEIKNIDSASFFAHMRMHICFFLKNNKQ